MNIKFDDGVQVNVPAGASILFSYVPEGADVASGRIDGPASVIVPMFITMMGQIFDGLTSENKKQFLSDLADEMVDLAKDADGFKVTIMRRRIKEDDDE